MSRIGRMPIPVPKGTKIQVQDGLFVAEGPKGRVEQTLFPGLLVLVHGVGYEVDVPMSTFYQLPAVGERVTLLTHFVVREDAQLLYGFLTHEERATFRQLIRISGVGPRTALSILSGLSVGELVWRGKVEIALTDNKTKDILLQGLEQCLA